MPRSLCGFRVLHACWFGLPSVSCLRDAGLALALVLGPALAVAQPPAAIVGDVSLGSRPNPLAGITVVLASDDGPDRTYTTDGSGTFTFPNLPAGTYYLYTSNTLGFTNEAYDDVLCELQCRSRRGRPIVLAPGTVFSTSFVLDLGGVIAGTVTAADTLAPLAGVTMFLYGLDTSDPPADIEAEMQTDAGGTYRFRGLPAGRYYVMTRNGLGYADELTDNEPCPGGGCLWALWSGAGTPVDLALGGVISRNFALDPGSRVTGTITDAVTGTPVGGVCVFVVRVFGGQVLVAGRGCSDSAGVYDVGGLPSGTYYAWAEAESAETGHTPELYDDVPCLYETCLRVPAIVAGGVPIVLGVGAVASGKNFVLTPGGGLRGRVSDGATGAPVANQPVQAVVRVAGVAVQVGSSTTDATGSYAISGLPSGTYYAYTNDSGYTSVVFDQVPCPGESCTRSDLSTVGTPIAVTAGTQTSGVDFRLRRNVPPPTPVGLRATVVNYVVTLSWNRPFPDPLTFIVEAGLSPGTTSGTAQTMNQSLRVSPVGPGRYYVRVRAANAYGVSNASEEIAVVVRGDGGDGSMPTAPGFLSGWMSGARLTLTWGTPSVGGPADRYLVEVGVATGQTSLRLSVAGPAFTYQPVPEGVYFLRVRSVNAAGVSPPSEEVRLHVGNVPSPPFAPWILDPLVIGGTVTLEWMSPPWQGPVTSHLLAIGSATGLTNLGLVNVGDATSLVVPGVPPGAYYVRVHTVNAVGASIASEEIEVVVR